MAERSVHSMGIFGKKSLLCVFTITSILLMLSWFFVLHSTNRPLLVDLSFSPNSKLLAIEDDQRNDKSRKDNNLDVREGMESSKYSCREILKVFMYDLPPQFHFGLLGWKQEGRSVWPDIRTKVPSYPGGLNLQHSVEYWLALDLLSSEMADDLSGRSAIRVGNSSEADVIFVPFFSSISMNRFSRLKRSLAKADVNILLQEKLVTFLKAQEEWKRSMGKDHIILAHHPNSLLDARTKLWSAMFILSDFGRYPPSIANVEKDVIAPYKHIVASYVNDSSDFDSRPTLLYFQGAIYRKDGGFIRQELFYMLKNEKDVHFAFGNIQKDGIKQATNGMHTSKYCLNIAGDTPSSNRLFDAIASHCVPVIISDEIELPYEDVLDYSEFCVFVRTSDALRENFLLELIRGIGKEEWTRMWNRLKEVENLFEYRYPSRGNDAVQMIWQAIARKVPTVRLKKHRNWRYFRTPVSLDTGFKSPPSLPKNFW